MSTTVRERRVEEDWDFSGADTKTDTHCYSAYPAMMIPQVAARLIAQYGARAKTLFDPYCGSGTSLVEANLKSINAHGSDLNPLARLIAKTKTARISLPLLDSHLQEFNDFAFQLNFGLCKTVAAPKFHNIDFWFKENTKTRLAEIKAFIDAIQNNKIQRFFLVAFAEAVRASSLTRNGEFKMYRISPSVREKFNPDVNAIVTAKLMRNRRGLALYLEKVKHSRAHTTVHNFNSAQRIDGIDCGSVDLVVTSPPYGDSKTTVAYGQFSRLANEWLGVENAMQIDRDLMGGKAREIEPTECTVVNQSVQKVGAVDAKRAREVYSFYADYLNSIANVASVVKRHGHVCYVVGNRTVKNIKLPTDEITRRAFERYGFKHKNTFIRCIPNKRMPSRNSPSNQSGQTSATINNEYILVLQKCTK